MPKQRQCTVYLCQRPKKTKNIFQPFGAMDITIAAASYPQHEDGPPDAPLSVQVEAELAVDELAQMLRNLANAVENGYYTHPGEFLPDL